MPIDRQSDLAGRVLLVRLGQMVVNEQYKDGDFKIPIHLALGHEAIAVAVTSSMRDEDKLLLTHRNIHYNLARRPDLASKIREFRLEVDGAAGGQLGCMNLYDEAAGIPYTSSILANNLGVASGVALAQRSLSTGGVTFVVTGDGAIEEGAFYESLLLARSVSVAMVVIVENNGWSLATRVEERRADIDLSAMAAAFNIPYRKLTGNDVVDYAATVSECRDQAQRENTPLVVEVELTTLGGWRQPMEGFPEGKYINYHAGPAPTVVLDRGPVIEESSADPIFVLARQMGADIVAEIARETLAAFGEVL